MEGGDFMSKKSKKRRRRSPPLTTCDRHHLCFVKARWNKGYAKAICQAFVRPVPVVYHRELHSYLHNVPIPNGKLLREAWIEYQKNKDEIDSYDVVRAAAWLYVHIPDSEFRKAMQFEIDFFSMRLERP